MVYDHAALEKKFTKTWRSERVYEPDLNAAENPYYNLMMFPYPSAEGLHVGNMYAFTGADVFGRFQRMLGKDVLEPIGLDGFGIHSENYAIKVGRHPAEQAKLSEDNFYRQLSMIGNGFSWETRLETYDPEYYRWTQWLFLQLFKHGLAYKAEALVNWCPTDKTVLADEQVEDGRCERCKTVVERRSMSSWFFRITDYADRLLDNIDGYQWSDREGKTHQGLNWPSKVTLAQKNWIGRSSGLEIDFSLASSEEKITVWTTFWETLFGVTYLVLAPEHELAHVLATEEKKSEVEAYITQALNRSEQDRQASKEKTGVFTGSYAVNPATGKKVPVWIADYVLSGVGTGAVMGVPAHDARDGEFAQTFSLPSIEVVVDGRLTRSGQFDGQSADHEGKEAFRAWAISQGFARERMTYHLRDWLISRQRYWGPPIPLIHCEACFSQGKGEREELPGWYSVPESELPVLLPHIEEFKPTGEGTSPLDNAPDEWKFVPCPGCGQKARRETDVSDTFLDSSWYFLRYPSVTDNSGPFPQVKGKQKDGKPLWFPVDAYIGGAEHAVLHLLYARFITMALHDWGFVPQEEPFPFLFGHGLIIKDGAKMSKSRGNVVNPDEYIEKYGADALRSYLMFLGPYEQGGDFRDTGMHGMYKWLSRVWELFQTVKPGEETSLALRQKLHRTILENTREISQFRYNTCLSRLMETVNVWKEGNTLGEPEAVLFLQLLAPFAPFLTEELYQQIQAGRGVADFSSIHRTPWPQADTAYLAQAEVSLAVQVNGKTRGFLSLSPEDAQRKELVEVAARAQEGVQRHLTFEPKKTIFVPGKIINFIG